MRGDTGIQSPPSSRRCISGSGCLMTTQSGGGAALAAGCFIARLLPPELSRVESGAHLVAGWA